MKKLLTILVSILSLIITFTVAGCGGNPANGGNTGKTEIDQWDYFDQYVSYTLYEYIEDNTDWTKNLISNSSGEIQPNCYMVVLSLDDNVNIKDISSHSDYNFYRQIAVRRSVSDKKITLTKLSIKIYAEADCEMTFSLKVGGTPCSVTTINVAANAASELLFENFAEYTWDENSMWAITINLENPSAIGNVKYAFSDLKLTLKTND